tara:strand:- start:3137 stop:3691 length:555 start_codon:yes stop_codon:yes gene_type:complete
MTRSISAATIAELEKDDFNLATLIQFDLATTIYLTDWNRDLSISGQTWVSSSHFLGSGDITETADLRVNSIDVTLSGVSQEYVNIFLAQNYIDRTAKIYRAVVNDSDAVIGSPILVFDGLMTGYNIQDGRESSTVTVKLASHWKDFEKEVGRKTNQNSQSIHFPNDKGFEFSAKTIKNLKWGRK